MPPTLVYTGVEIFCFLMVSLSPLSLNRNQTATNRVCPLPEGNFTDLTEECFQQNPLDFMQDEQTIVFPNGAAAGLAVASGAPLDFDSASR